MHRWPSAAVLASLAPREIPAASRLIELGAGTGLAGLVFASRALCGAVTLSDRKGAVSEKKRLAKEAAEAQVVAREREEKSMTREAREARYVAEIDNSKATLKEHKDMWIKLVKDSEVQIQDLKKAIEDVDREAAALRSSEDEARKYHDLKVRELEGLLVATKLSAAEISSDVDMLQHHMNLVRRHQS